jgi:hypothetical protein
MTKKRFRSGSTSLVSSGNRLPVQRELAYSALSSALANAFNESSLNPISQLAPGLALYEAAYSKETLEMTQRIGDLRSPPSPASLTSTTAGQSLEERLFDATANVKILTSQIAMHLDRDWRNRLFRQLDSLHDPKEWEREDEPIQQASFATFLKAIVSIKPARRPGLGLSHTGNLIAAWTVSSERLTIEFLQNDRVRWVIGRLRDNEPEQIAGHTHVSRLNDSLEPYEPSTWFSS